MPSRRAWVLALVLLASRTFAAQFGDPDDLMSLEVHGFASQGFIYATNQNLYLAENSNKGSFEFTELGVNFTKQLLDNFRVGFQLFSRDLGPIGNYTIRADWYYLDWHYRDWFGVRAGRVKLPFGLYNDTSDIDSARVPVLLPQSLYPSENRDYLLAQTGVEIYGRFNLEEAGALEYRFYGGTVFIDPTLDRLPATTVDFTSLTTPYIFGGRLMYETPIEGLRFGASAQFLELDIDLATRTTPILTATLRIPAVLWVASVEYATHDLLLAAEYSRWYTVNHSSDNAVIPSNSGIQSERGYVMASYRVTKWFTPGAYYSLLYPNAEVRTGREAQQHDIAATLRFDINPYWLVKLEGHFMAGTAGLNVGLNDNRPLSTLAPYWGAFFIKTTAHF